MPTITLSWTDLALFSLTVGLIGSVLLICRSSSTQGVTSGKKVATSKKKKNRSKKGSINAPPPTSTSSNNLSAHSTQSSVSLPPPTTPPKVLSETASNQLLSHPITQLIPKSVDPNLDEDFPALSSTNQIQKTKKEPNPQRPFAERHMQPIRKTIVDDMIDQDVEKPLKMSRVMNIVNPTPQVPLSPISDSEEGWEKVPNSRPKKSRHTDHTIRIASSASHQAPSSTAQPSQQKPSKRQRQNAKKKEAVKALKAADEADRLRQLALHKRDLERVKINAQSPSTINNKPAGKQISGGMKSTIGQDGRLIWE